MYPAMVEAHPAIPIGMLILFFVSLLGWGVLHVLEGARADRQSRADAAWSHRRTGPSHPGLSPSPRGVRPAAGPGTPELGPAAGITIRTRVLP
jgi:hypothetical protein